MSDQPRRYLSNRKLLTFCLVGLFAYIFFGFVSLGLDMKSSIAAFRQRHVEATQGIERIYAYFRSHNQWPAKADVEAYGKQWLPQDWNYHVDEAGAALWLHGPYHTILSYRFAPPNQGRIDNSWTLSVEGDKTDFQADVPYR